LSACPEVFRPALGEILLPCLRRGSATRNNGRRRASILRASHRILPRTSARYNKRLVRCLSERKLATQTNAVLAADNVFLEFALRRPAG
jgi:hypothetical protein